MQMKDRGITLAVLSVVILSLAQAQAQESVPRNAVLEFLKDNPSPLPASCLDPVFGPIEWRLGSSDMYLSGCDEELTYMVLGTAREVSSLNSFRFSFDGNRYDLLLPGPIEDPAVSVSSEISRLSEDDLSQMAERLRESKDSVEP